MIFGMKIGLLIGGLIALITGKFRLSKARIVEGAAARAAGLVLMLPLPLGYAIGFAIGLLAVLQGKRLDVAEWRGPLIALDLGVLAACCLLGFGIALLASPASKPGAAAPATRRPAPGSLWRLAGALGGGFLVLIAAGAVAAWWVVSSLPDQPRAGVGVEPGQAAAQVDAAVEPGPNASGIAALGIGAQELEANPAELNTPARPPFAVDPQLAAAGAVAYLRDLQPFDSLEGNDGWGAAGQVLFEGQLSPHGLVFTPAFGGGAARRRYALGKQASVFKSAVAVTDNPHGYRLGVTPAVFVVLGDGQELWRSKPIAQNGMSDACVLDMSKVEVLEVRVLQGFGVDSSAPAWIEPRLFKDRAAANDDPLMGTIRGAPEPPAPRAARLPLKENDRRLDGLTITSLRLGGEGVLPCLCWSADGQSFFYLDGPHGVLGQVALDRLEEVRRLEVGGRCSWLSTSAEGLLVTVPERSQVWVVDPNGLRVKSRLAVPAVERAVSAPGLAAGFARGLPAAFPGGAHLYALDLKTGGVTRAVIDGLADKFLPAWEGIRLTPDGKYLFTRHTELNRFRVDGLRLTYEDTGPNVAGQGRILDLALSPDSRFVCLPAGAGNDIAGPFPGRPNLRPYSLYVYRVSDLHHSAFPLEIGAYPLVVGFDPAAHLVYAQNSNYQLIVFSEDGVLKNQYRISDSTGEVRQFLAHAAGRKLLVLAAKLYFIEMSGTS
jgi:hypothetical protein